METGTHKSLKKHLEQLAATEPDVAHGLMALLEGSEDFTCLTLKSILGKRGKGGCREVM